MKKKLLLALVLVLVIGLPYTGVNPQTITNILLVLSVAVLRRR